MPDRPGRYKARIKRWKVDETGNNKLATFVCEFECYEWYSDTDERWYSLPCEITGYFYLERKDGNINEFAVNSLRDSLGWDGRDIGTLADTEWRNTPVQITVEQSEYNGKSRLSVDYINPLDYEPTGIGETKPEVVQALNNRLGAKLRAIAPPINHSVEPPTAAPQAPPAANPQPPKSLEGEAPIKEEDIPFD